MARARQSSGLGRDWHRGRPRHPGSAIPVCWGCRWAASLRLAGWSTW